jgi:hypothetical protein
MKHYLASTVFITGTALLIELWMLRIYVVLASHSGLHMAIQT